MTTVLLIGFNVNNGIIDLLATHYCPHYIFQPSKVLEYSYDIAFRDVFPFQNYEPNTLHMMQKHLTCNTFYGK